MPESKTYNGGMLPEVTIIAKSKLHAQLLALPGSAYHNNPQLFRFAMQYMQRSGDVEGERQIFRKSLGYGHNEAGKRTLLLMGGVALAGATPFIIPLASSPGSVALAGKLMKMGKVAINLFEATAYWRMGINAGTQALLSDEGWRGINVVSVAAEGIPLRRATLLGSAALWGANAMIPLVEWAPFSEKENLKIGFKNKTVSETIFDIGLQAATSLPSTRLTTTIKDRIRQGGDDFTIKCINNLFYPTFYSGYHISTQTVGKGAKEKYISNKKSRHEK